MTKTCIHCHTPKPLSAFLKHNQRADGRDNACRECRREVGRQSVERARLNTSPDTIKCCSKCQKDKPLDEYHMGWALHGRISVCKACVKTRSHTMYIADKGKWLERNRKWRRENPEKEKAQSARNRASARRNLQWHIDRRVLRKVDRYAKHGISRVMRSDTEYAVGWTFLQLRQHIESLFTEGMSWDLVLAGKIEIDHIIPRCSFYYETIHDADFKACWALGNLRPLWKAENRSKAYRMPDGSNGRELGRRKREAYELRLVQMGAGGSDVELAAFLV